MTLKTKILFTAMLAASSMAYASDHCEQMVPFGYPTHSLANTSQLCRIGYTLLHNNRRKVAVYSAEWLVIENAKAKVKRVNAFKADPDLVPNYRSELADYENDTKLYDRGHLTPFEDASRNSVAALQTFYLSNIVPQNLHFNRGIWRSLENQTRKWAETSQNGLYVMTGPIFSGKVVTIGDGVSVPTSMYKVIINKETMQGVGFIIPNDKPVKGMKLVNYKVPIKMVERTIGVNFTPSLRNDSFKNVIGSEFN